MELLIVKSLVMDTSTDKDHLWTSSKWRIKYMLKNHVKTIETTQVIALKHEVMRDIHKLAKEILVVPSIVTLELVINCLESFHL